MTPTDDHDPRPDDRGDPDADAGSTPGEPESGHEPEAGHDPAACVLAWQTLRAAHDRVERRLAVDLAEGCGLAINELDVLVRLRCRRAEGVRVSGLLDAVPLSQPALSRLVARLEIRGLVSRSAAEGDGRATVVRLTPAGEALLGRAVVVHAAAVDAALTAHLTPDEQAVLLATLARVAPPAAPDDPLAPVQ